MLCALGIAVALSVQSAHANSAPPPRRMWFYFDKGVLPSAMQIIGCSDAACTQINLLHEYGRCESADCIDTPQALTAASDYFDCADGRCLFASYAELPPYIKLVAQFADGDRSSAALAIDPSAQWSMSAWRLESTAQTLQVTPAKDIPGEQLAVGRLDKIFRWLFPSGLLTIVIESLVIALLLFLVVKLPLPVLPAWIATVVLANLLSYPATWLFFPHLTYWSTASERLSGGLAILFAALMAALLIGARNTPRRGVRVGLIIAAVAVLVISCVLSISVLMIASYGNVTPGSPNGLPFPLMLVLAEAFAVLFETLFIYGFSKRQFTLPLTFFLVLAANAASFGVGLLVFTPFALR